MRWKAYPSGFVYFLVCSILGSLLRCKLAAGARHSTFMLEGDPGAVNATAPNTVAEHGPRLGHSLPAERGPGVNVTAVVAKPPSPSALAARLSSTIVKPATKIAVASLLESTAFMAQRILLTKSSGGNTGKLVVLLGILLCTCCCLMVCLAKRSPRQDFGKEIFGLDREDPSDVDIIQARGEKAVVEDIKSSAKSLRTYCEKAPVHFPSKLRMRKKRFIAVIPDAKDGAQEVTNSTVKESCDESEWHRKLMRWQRGRVAYWKDASAFNARQSPLGWIELMSISKVAFDSKGDPNMVVLSYKEETNVCELKLWFETPESAHQWGKAFSELRLLLKRTGARKCKTTSRTKLDNFFHA